MCTRFLELLQSMESNGTDKLAMEVVSTGLINTYLFQINPISVCAQYSETHSFYREIYTGSFLIHDTHTYIVKWIDWNQCRCTKWIERQSVTITSAYRTLDNPIITSGLWWRLTKISHEYIHTLQCELAINSFTITRIALFLIDCRANV